MNLDSLKNADLLTKLLIALVVAVLLPVLAPIIMAALGLLLVLIFVDMVMGGDSLTQVADKLAAWLKTML